MELIIRAHLEFSLLEEKVTRGRVIETLQKPTRIAAKYKPLKGHISQLYTIFPSFLDFDVENFKLLYSCKSISRNSHVWVVFQS